MTMETILEEAQRLVAGDRQNDYGHPLDCCDRIGRLWSVVLGIEVPAEKVAECLGLMKYARLQQGYKRDTIVDMAGYAQVLQMIVEERERRDRASRAGVASYISQLFPNPALATLAQAQVAESRI